MQRPVGMKRGLALLLVGFLGTIAPREACADVRSYVVTEPYVIRSTGPTTYRTKVSAAPTAGGKASCMVTSSGTQAMAGVAGPVFVRVEIVAGDTTIGTQTGASVVVATANVSAGSAPLACVVSLTPGVLGAVSTGTIRLDVPTEVRAPTVSVARMFGTPAMGMGVEGYHVVDYAPPGARVRVEGTFLRLATVRFGAATRATPVPPSSDTALYFDMPSLPVGATQLVVENPQGQASIPWFVGVRRPQIDKATIDTYGRVTVWGQDFAPIVPSGTPVVRTTIRFGDGEWMTAFGNDHNIWYTSPKGVFHGMVRVKTFAGDSSDVWM